MRFILGFASVLLFVMPIAAAPYHAGAQPEMKKAKNRQELINAIQRDLAQARDKLAQKDPGAATRAAQKQIVDNITKLLEPDAPPPSSSSTEPHTNPLPDPPPSVDPGKPKQKPASTMPRLFDPPLANPRQPDSTPGQQRLEKSKNASKNSPGSWGDRRWRERVQIDAYGNGRLMPRYENLLREYYRSIAESSSRGD